MKQILAVLIIIFALSLSLNFIYEQTALQKKTDFGVSFSPKYATQLGLNWQEVYQDILQNLKVKLLRLNSYWTEVEPNPGQYEFDNLDYMLSKAQQENVKVLLVIGTKQPHWPECFVPDWAKKLSLQERQQKTLTLLETVVKRYRDNPTIWGWQVENEPIFQYGAGCDPIDREFTKKEVLFVKSLDKRPIVISDSGELRIWRTPMQLSDIFGTTIYRNVYGKGYGYFDWPLLPVLYNLKSSTIRNIFAPNNTRTIIVEMQAEPWLIKTIKQTPITEQSKIFTLNDLINNVIYAKKTGFGEVYLWGAEWWYFMAKNGHPEYLDYAKELLREQN